jgi:hypothetical protein
MCHSVRPGARRLCDGQNVCVTTAVPNAEETEAIFGANPDGNETQPIWVKVENHSD